LKSVLWAWAVGRPFWSEDTPLGWGKVDDDESLRAIQCALDLGITFFDTADVYGAGHSERVLARAFEGRRQDVVIATKFSNIFDEDTRQVSGSSAEPAHIHQACEASLRRLKTDYIDLYQFHNNGYPANKAALVRDTLEELGKEGKNRAYGWSTDFLESAEVFAQGANCAAIQLQLNVLDVNPALVALCEKYGLSAINRGPLAMGLLTGKYTASTKPSVDDVRGENSPEWLNNMVAVREILTSEGRTLAQGALAWLWTHSPQTLPIPGFRTVV
jgi:aryl-alcohol dehydrogenase-like predicted oxidoreductase